MDSLNQVGDTATLVLPDINTRKNIRSLTSQTPTKSRKLKSSKKNRKEKIKYKSAIDYLRKKRPSRN